MHIFHLYKLKVHVWYKLFKASLSHKVWKCCFVTFSGDTEVCVIWCWCAPPLPLLMPLRAAAHVASILNSVKHHSLLRLVFSPWFSFSIPLPFPSVLSSLLNFFLIYIDISHFLLLKRHKSIKNPPWLRPFFLSYPLFSFFIFYFYHQHYYPDFILGSDFKWEAGLRSCSVKVRLQG